MKFLIFNAIFCVAAALYDLRKNTLSGFRIPDGAVFIDGDAGSSDLCDKFHSGCYVDYRYNCKVFHICQTDFLDDGSVDVRGWSFLCGNQNVFSQDLLKCVPEDEATPCVNSVLSRSITRVVPHEITEPTLLT
ncbi:uncharacterized protein LOC143256190 [Tachypleus tridentatus]|uniref:uncharacterized protein LOC143256190 n=1 Tax=Tachypleus tridentatus TaxID=6853 RepID=UPI003FD5435F